MNSKSFTDQENLKTRSVDGKLLHSSKLNVQHSKIDLSSYQKGSYIVFTTINEIQKSFVVIKE
jgi:hypothetical protein